MNEQQTITFELLQQLELWANNHYYLLALFVVFFGVFCSLCLERQRIEIITRFIDRL